MMHPYASRSIQILQIIGSCLGVAAFIGSSLLYKEIQLMTPIVILDRNRMIRGIPNDAIDSERKAVINRLNSIEQEFATAGYLVVDSQWVLAAPKSLFLPLEQENAP